MKTLCVYATHTHSFNLDFFIKYGLVPDDDIDFHIVLNNPQMKLVAPHAQITNRPNHNGDFGAWAHILLEQMPDGQPRWKQYQKFLLLNSTIRGPFFPVWHTDKHWVKLFTDRLNKQDKLIGITIGWDNYPPRVNSMLLTLDEISMQLAIDANIFSKEEPKLSHQQLIEQKEVAISQVILDSNYNIGCMLKALHGIDFRQDRTIRDYSFFLRYHYYGVDVHPYETIFIKTKNQVGTYERTPYIECMTLWQTSPHSLEQHPFDWKSYLLEHSDLWDAGIRTKAEVMKHFNTYGYREGRVYHSKHDHGKFYHIDLNVNGYHGLINQIYCLANAIIIGHYTGRSINIQSFYPQYNSFKSIPIEQVLDIDRLNLLIASLGLTCRIGTNGAHFKPTNSLYKNWNIEGTPVEVFHKLRQETRYALNLGNTFFFMLQRSMDSELEVLFRKLVNGIHWSDTIETAVSKVKSHLSLTNYSAVHLRMEDDIVAHGGNFNAATLAAQYFKNIQETHSSKDSIFIATNLGKVPNKYNNMLVELEKLYPNLKTSIDWRKVVSWLPEGREIDAIIDYQICRGANLCIGYKSSTFSEALSFHFMEIQQPFYDCAIVDEKLYNIVSSHITCGKLGMNNLGHVASYQDRMTSEIILNEPVLVAFGAHAPSYIQMRVNKPFFIQGYCSPTAINAPKMTFRCDGHLIGVTEKMEEKTTAYKLEIGMHTITVETSSTAYAHAILLLKDSVIKENENCIHLCEQQSNCKSISRR